MNIKHYEELKALPTEELLKRSGWELSQFIAHEYKLEQVLAEEWLDELIAEPVINAPRYRPLKPAKGKLMGLNGHVIRS